MTREEILARMDAAAKEDRQRFFAVADALQFQPKWNGRLADIETVKQQWRDMTDVPEYPEIKFPLDLPDWFPIVRFASRWDADYVQKTLERVTKDTES